MIGLPETLGVFVGSLGHVLSWPTFGYLLIGAFIGFWVGILPGLGGAASLAMMLPFAFTLEPVAAIAFLLASRAVAGTASDLTSIFFGVPGDGAAAATVFDGYPMSRRGLAGRAVGAALSSSLLAGCLGALLLALAIPIVQPLVLAFGPAEFFMLALLGLSFIAILSGDAPLKGLIMACIGLILATVGQHPGTGIFRYTFGQPYLWDGIDVTLVTIGLFAVPALISMMATRSDSFLPSSEEITDSWVEGFRDCFRHWWLVVRCSFIGAFFGLIPGVGGSSSQFIVYGHARQTSRHPETFGKGNVEGVLAAGSNNNANDGPQLLPTIVFAVPGSASMAIVLAALVIMGLVPGAQMLTTNLDVTFSMVWTIIVANIVAVLGCLLVLKYIMRIMRTKGTRLVPFILVFIFIGAYGVGGQWADILVMMAFGAFGVAAAAFGWPVPPLLLGLVLGFTAETNLFLANSLADGLGWLGRPGVIGIGIVILLGAFGPFLARVARGETRLRLPRWVMVRTFDLSSVSLPRLIFTLCLVLVPLVAIQQAISNGFPKRAAQFPIVVGCVSVALLVVQILFDLLRAERPALASPDPIERNGGTHVPVTGMRAGAIATEMMSLMTPEALDRTRLTQALVQFAAFAVLLWLLGFLVAVPLFTFAYLATASRERFWNAAIGGVAAWLLLYLLFVQFSDLDLFEGYFFASIM